ncbi:Gfo/Idh/MocA family protein [Paenibacillus chungangensis]|uniref:Gfo/Idh/MocA family protein n=1 Tax=Paenibacillus chungangensis TaxID=696535 RepID=A0ABW3HU77_9BACL
MAKKLKLGIAGTGNIFKQNHLKTLLEHPEVEIAAVCDANEAYAAGIAKEYGIPHVFSDYREMLKRSEIDVVDICTPNLYHSEIGIAALNAGKHVFCEKPEAVNPEEARKMAEAAKESGKTMMAMRNNRFTHASQYLKKYITDGWMGEIYTGRCGWIRRRGIPGKGGWFTTKELSGGGPLIDLGVHMIDLAVWLMGNPKPVSVSGATYANFHNNELSDSTHSQFGEKQKGGVFDVEDLAIGFIRFENGATLQLEFSWASNIGEEMNFVELRGTKSGSSMKKGELQIFTEVAGRIADISPLLGKQPVDTHGENLKHFIDVIQGRSAPMLTPEHGVDMISILAAIYQSAQLGREVRLDDKGGSRNVA